MSKKREVGMSPVLGEAFKVPSDDRIKVGQVYTKKRESFHYRVVGFTVDDLVCVQSVSLGLRNTCRASNHWIFRFPVKEFLEKHTLRDMNRDPYKGIARKNWPGPSKKKKVKK